VTNFPLPATWDELGLAGVGFRGFKLFSTVTPDDLPVAHGLYVILRPAIDQAVILPTSRRRLKPYAVEDLLDRWVAGAPVVYIGSTIAKTGLQGRIGAFRRQATNHSGGRSIWQLRDADELVCAWVETPNHKADRVEDDYHDAFVKRYAKLPFANRKRRKIQ
jgi:hypothetical protein